MPLEQVTQEVAMLVPGVVLAAVWSGVAAFGVDADSHRRVLAAAAGGPHRLHRARFVAVLVMGLPAVAVLTVWAATAAGPRDAPTLLAAVAALCGAWALGSAWAGLLGRPVVQRIPVAVLGGCVLGLGSLLIGPILRLLDRLGNAELAAGWLIAALGAGAAASWRGSGRSWRRRE
ncbi:MAG: hypothetical protein R2705_11390 [Ilumatobacteraceae bacterium]